MEFIINALNVLLFVILPISLAFSLWSYIFEYIYENTNIFNESAVLKNQKISFYLVNINTYLFLFWIFFHRASGLVILFTVFSIILLSVYSLRDKKYLLFSFLCHVLVINTFTVIIFYVTNQEIFLNVFSEVLSLVMQFYIIFCLFMLGIYFFLLWSNINNKGIYYLICIFSVWGGVALILYFIVNYKDIIFNIPYILLLLLLFIMLVITYVITLEHGIRISKRFQIWGAMFFPMSLTFAFYNYPIYKQLIDDSKRLLISTNHKPLYLDLSVILNGIMLIVILIVTFFTGKLILTIIYWKRK